MRKSKWKNKSKFRRVLHVAVVVCFVFGINFILPCLFDDNEYYQDDVLHIHVRRGRARIKCEHGWLQFDGMAMHVKYENGFHHHPSNGNI